MSDNLEDIEYTPDQRRVADYIFEVTGIGGGTDPIGFLIASHQMLRYLRAQERKDRAE